MLLLVCMGRMTQLLTDNDFTEQTVTFKQSLFIITNINTYLNTINLTSPFFFSTTLFPDGFFTQISPRGSQHPFLSLLELKESFVL